MPLHGNDRASRQKPYREAVQRPQLSLAVVPIDDDLRPSGRFEVPPVPRSYWLTFVVSAIASPLLVYALDGPGVLVLAAALCAPTVLAKLVDRLVFAPRAARAFNVALIAAQEASSRGLLDDAEAQYRRLMKRFRGRGGLEAIALHHLSTVRAKRRDIAGALRILHALHAYPGTKRAPAVTLVVPLQIALFAAQIGDVGEARRWLSIGRAAAGKAKMYTGNVEALILTREERYAEAEALYEAQWPDLERVLAAPLMRAVRARRAFALEKRGADAEEVRRMVEGARPTSSDELAHLGEGWDEMHAFLDRHGLL